MRFHFDAVESGDQALIRAGVEYASMYLGRAAGVQVREVDVFAGSDLVRLTQDFISFFGAAGFPAAGFMQRISNGVAEAHLGSVFVYTQAPIWKQANAVQRVRVVAHEFAHILQFQLMGEELATRFFTREATDPQQEGPSWFLEGTADLISWRSMEAGGLTTLDDQLDRVSADLAGSDLHPRAMEAFIDYLAGRAESIDMSLLAAELLMRGREERVLVRYFELVRSGAAWQQAFTAAFGETPAAFYLRFDAYKASGFDRP